jgi:MoaA/NifB/PqqE/SkfB family radical SAM enzyme
LNQAKELGTINWIYFEGGEPFLYYAIMLKGIQEAVSLGFNIGIVTNTYWATSEEDALVWLEPMQGLVEDLSISSDLFHYSEKISQQLINATAAAEKLGLPIGVISVAKPSTNDIEPSVGQLPVGESSIMYRGRAANKLISKAPLNNWEVFNECPYEDLREPGRIHIDPLGNLHICQGITIGNLFKTPLTEICDTYNPGNHPITGPLLNGGPVELVNRYNVQHNEEYADACHLCYETRSKLRNQYPDVLNPDQMYGVFEGNT